MSGMQILANVAGLGFIGWVVWYFWLWKPKGFSAEIKEDGGSQEAEITVKGGYQPSVIIAKAGKPLRLKVTRREPSTCGEEMVLSDFGKRVHLPQGETITVDLLPEKAGEFTFNCPMGMYRGRLVVEA